MDVHDVNIVLNVSVLFAVARLCGNNKTVCRVGFNGGCFLHWIFFKATKRRLHSKVQ